MPAKKAAGENSKKAQGQARKAEAAAAKNAAKDRQAEEAEAQEWNKGSKSNAKAEAAAAKAAEAARKKAEKDALLAEEEASLPSKTPKNSKTAQKKTRGIDSAFASLDNPAALNATGIDNALDALSLTSKPDEKIDRHPERRYKAAYAKYEERRLEEMKDDKSLRKQQKMNKIYEEFKKHPDNPFNQVAASYNATKEELAAMKEEERIKKEKRLANPTA
jgi:hypothetical protein